MSYPVYGEYKATRWPEVGHIPTGWEARRLKFSATCNDETLPETTDPDFEMAYVDISSVGLVNGITAVEVQTFEKAPSRARRIVRHGDTLISTVRTYLKAIAPVDAPPENMIVSTGFAVVRPLGFIHSGFLGYALQNTAFIDAVVANSTGVSYPAINPTSLICLAVCYPKDKKEQQQIAAFLDWKTGQIDALIAKKKELMDKLKEKRLAVITQAVTKGLNPAAPLRDSGIPWLGAVPAHWDVTYLRWFLRTGSGDFLSNEDMERYPDEIHFIPVVGGNGIMGYTSGWNTDANCLVAGRVGAHCGNIHLIREKCWVTDNALRIGMIDDVFDSEYLYWLLKSMNLNDDANRNAQPLITGETVKSKKVALPPLSEQKFIADHLTQKTTAIHMMQAKIESAIARLTEYRTALITAATTGKIDVRQVAIPRQSAQTAPTRSTSIDSIACTA
ncbi:MAG: restriction endonuclease subunit S [Burkholderiales bacterium]|nr:restriction endonuclease subunit S [Burkholderiales bacterium]